MLTFLIFYIYERLNFHAQLSFITSGQEKKQEVTKAYPLQKWRENIVVYPNIIELIVLLYAMFK